MALWLPVVALWLPIGEPGTAKPVEGDGHKKCSSHLDESNNG
jgi:hypothetical protein